MIDRLQSHYGFTRPPFSKTLTPNQLHHHAGHSQAVARITWCVNTRAIGLLCGESGAGKTVAARAAIAALDQTRHTLIYLANPTTGARGYLKLSNPCPPRPARASERLGSAWWTWLSPPPSSTSTMWRSNARSAGGDTHLAGGVVDRPG